MRSRTCVFGAILGLSHMTAGHLDLLTEAVGWIQLDGVLRADNRAMREICSEVSTGESNCFLDMPFAGEGLMRLRRFFESPDERGEVHASLSTESGDRTYAITLARAMDGHVVVMRDQTELLRIQARMRRLDRLAVIGTMGGDLLHDLNNLMGGMVGLADHLADVANDPDQSEFLSKVIAGTKARGTILTRLFRLFESESNRGERVGLGSIAEDAFVLFEKAANHAKIEFTFDLAEDLPEVLVVPEDVNHLVLFVLTQALQGDRKLVHVEVRCEQVVGDQSIDLPARTYGVIRMLDDGDVAEGERLNQTLGQTGRDGIGGKAWELDDTAQGLFMVVMSLRAFGGSFRCEGLVRGLRSTALYLPLAENGGD